VPTQASSIPPPPLLRIPPKLFRIHLEGRSRRGKRLPQLVKQLQRNLIDCLLGALNPLDLPRLRPSAPLPLLPECSHLRPINRCLLLNLPEKPSNSLLAMILLSQLTLLIPSLFVVDPQEIGRRSLLVKSRKERSRRRSLGTCHPLLSIKLPTILDTLLLQLQSTKRRLSPMELSPSISRWKPRNAHFPILRSTLPPWRDSLSTTSPSSEYNKLYNPAQATQGLIRFPFPTLALFSSRIAPVRLQPLPLTALLTPPSLVNVA